MKKAAILVALAVLCPVTAVASVTYVNLGTTAPVTTLGPYALTPYSVSAQAALADMTSVSTIPGAPFGALGVSPNVSKRTVPTSWATWSHGYTGPVFDTTGNTVTLSLPAGTAAFEFYAEPDSFGIFTITATTDTGATSGPVNVNGSSGATGFGFYTTAGESIVSITITTNDSDFAFGEFYANGTPVSPVPALGPMGLALLVVGIAGAGLLLLKGRIPV